MTAYVVEPFLHVTPSALYNPLTGRSLAPSDPRFERVSRLASRQVRVADLESTERRALESEGWLTEDRGPQLARRFRLRVATLEGSLHCNQACYFCPVSVNPRGQGAMDLELYGEVARQLAEHAATLEAVFMISYNEPTIDPLFLERVEVLEQFGLPAAVNTNATGLTPSLSDALLELGGLLYLSVNLSTLDRERYRRERGQDHLPIVLRNLDYAAHRPLADQMDIAVLGTDAQTTERDFQAIRRRFAGSRFRVRKFAATDRAGYLPVGLKPAAPRQCLAGCDNLGSRPIEHVHIDASGRCFLCCEDYDGRYVLGDLTRQSLREVLTGDAAARLRRQVYGLEESDTDFICRRCTFALTPP